MEVVSSAGIHFLTPNTLIEVVKRIESNLPGWWWSFSQKVHGNHLSMGPGRNCPNLIDVEFSKTSVGDKGLHNTFCSSREENELLFLSWLDGIILGVNDYRDVVQEDHPELSQDKVESQYRYQNVNNLNRLHFWYHAFLADLDVLETKTYVLDEIYLGSCDLSADCSLRGRSSEGEFDITIDLTNRDVGIADSLRHAITELKNDILT